jgi:CRISPR-associated protein Csb3
MAEASIPVDLLNPGQVFACLGFMEAAEILCGPCEGRFAYDGSESQTLFVMRVSGTDDPVLQALRFLVAAEVKEVAPMGWSVPLARKKKETDEKYARRLAEHKAWLDRIERSPAFPSSGPESPATLIAALRAGGKEIALDYWTDGSSRPGVKFWAGAGGYPGTDLTRDALSLIRALGAAQDPFRFWAPQSSSFRFDWRRDYIPIDAGFSPNEHSGGIEMVGYPVVELLAAVGMQNARPALIDPRNKLAYRYGVSNAMLPTVFVRAVLGGEGLGFPIRLFRMRLGWPGQEGQARCIIDAQEETRT